MMKNAMKITICGAGTLGANLAENLARTGLGALSIIDRDRVEERNLLNQPFLRQDVGQPKVKALAEFLYRAVGAKVSGIYRELTPGNVQSLVQDSELVIDAFDNEGARRAVKDFCERMKKPCLHVGISDDGYGELIWNEYYLVPQETGRDACEHPQNRSLSLLVTAIATELIATFIRDGVTRNYSVTQKDLSIERLDFAAR